ncbi:MAG: (Fe-S)-binding protein [Candidatus Nezhaarchaeota archaeon]|nr:(Fe-S)-binding protein [Candidatus Nezhaarchaeota archaeon]
MFSEEALSQIRRIEGVLEVLDDEEDLYVYSLEKPLSSRLRRRPSLVVKVRPEAAKRVMGELSGRGLRPALRGGEYDEGAVVVDPLIPPDLEELDAEAANVERRRSEAMAKVVEEALKAGASVLKRLSIALGALVKSRQVGVCRECEACSGYCSVAPFYNYVETWTSKGRLLLIRGFEANEVKATPKLAEVVYTCTLCGACFIRCLSGGFPGLETFRAIMAARRDLAERGLAPGVFKSMASSIATTGNPFAAPSDLRWMWLEEAGEVKVDRPAEVLLWIGCTTGIRLPEVAQACVKVLRLAGVDFAVLGPEENCCGDPLILSGMWREAEREAARVLEVLRRNRYQCLVTPCAGCYHAFAGHYPELLKVELPCEVLHVSQILEKLVREGRVQLGRVEVKAAYHDPCELGRLSGVYEPPRRVLKSIEGLELLEPKLSREKARCCGGGGGLWAYKSRVSMDAAELKLTRDVKPLGVERLITACPACYMNFRYTSIDRSIPIEVQDLVEIVLQAAERT